MCVITCLMLLWIQHKPEVYQMGGVPVSLCVCAHICSRAWECAHALSLFPFYGVWNIFFLLKPCCFGTPWAFKPLGGRYGLVFEFPAAHGEVHKQLAHIQCTVSPTRTAQIHAHSNTDVVSESTEHVWQGFVLSFLDSMEDKKSIWRGNGKMEEGRRWM